MPFGVSLAPEEFECKLHEKLDDHPGVVVLRDDVLVMGYGETQEEAIEDHDSNLIKLLQRARETNLKLNKSKIKFRQPEVKFMGLVITKQGLKPDPDKVKAVDEMPSPTCKKELASLLGSVNYLSHFLPRLPEVTQLLHELTAKDAPFLWSPQHESPFASIKQLVADHPVLKFYDPGAKSLCSATQASKDLGLRYSKVVSLLHSRHVPCHAQNGITHSLRKSVQLSFLNVSVLISISPQRTRLSSKRITNRVSPYSRSLFTQRHAAFKGCSYDCCAIILMSSTRKAA